MIRLTVDEIRDACNKYNLVMEPGAYLYVGSPKPCCALGAIAIAKDPGLRVDNSKLLPILRATYKERGWSDSYVAGIIRGFDGKRQKPEPGCLSPGELADFNLGYEDGKAVRILI